MNFHSFSMQDLNYSSSKTFSLSLEMFLNYSDDDCNVDNSLTEDCDDINETRRNSLNSLASTALTNSEIAHVANYVHCIRWKSRSRHNPSLH